MSHPTSFPIKPGGVTLAQGFLAGAVYAGIKPGNEDRRDFALILSEVPAVAAATFTTNKIKAAPVRVSQANLRSGDIRGVLLNSGNANACNGIVGIQHAKRSLKAVAQVLKLRDRQLLVCSTGRIGVELPIEKMEAAAALFPESLSRKNSRKAAKAIMTSDTFLKEIAVQVAVGGKVVSIGGIAKGAGMINPNMATMLSVVTTDLAIEKRELQRALSIAVEQSYNRITVDGDMSTNDTVILLANGATGGDPVTSEHPDFPTFQEALNFVTRNLAKMIVEDGEGVSKFVEVQVNGAATFQDARKVANAIANSTLVKCAWNGEDPNWGRIMDAIGYSTARAREEMIDIYYDGLLAVQNGMKTATPLKLLRKVMKKRKFKVTVDLHLGHAQYIIYTTDLTAKYVELNKGE